MRFSFQQVRLPSDLHGPYRPAVGSLIRHTGEKSDAVLSGGGQKGVVHFADLTHAGDGIGAGAQLGGQDNGIARIQGVDLGKIEVDAPVVGCDTNIAGPDTGVLQVARALVERIAVRALIDLDVHAQAGDFKHGQIVAAVVEMLVINALSASDYVLVPVQADYLAAEDMTELVGTVQSIKRQINPKLKIGGVLLTMANETNFRKDIVATVKANFGKHLPVMDTVIPATVRLAEISTADKSIFQHEPRGRAADAYRSLTKEVLEIGHKERSRASDLSR